MNGNVRPKDLAHDHDHLALAGPFLGRPAIGAVNFAIRRLNLAAKIGAVDRDRAGQLRPIRIVDLGAERFAQLVREHVSRLVLAVEIPAEL
jgi:hypothetical protein